MRQILEVVRMLLLSTNSLDLEVKTYLVRVMIKTFKALNLMGK
jgi:hypothetical protein